MKSEGSSEAHARLVQEVLQSISRLPYVRGWKRVCGTFYQVRFGEGGKVSSAVAVTVGQEGEGDIELMLTRWDGACLSGWIECKTGKAVQNQAQIDWEAFVKSRGGIYILARSPDDPLPFLDQWRNKGRPGPSA